MEPALQASIGNQLVAEEVLGGVAAAVVAHKLDKITMMQPAKHLDLNHELLIPLVPATRELLNGHWSSITQQALEDAAESSFSEHTRRFEVIRGFFKLFIWKKPCATRVTERTFDRNEFCCGYWLH